MPEVNPWPNATEFPPQTNLRTFPFHPSPQVSVIKTVKVSVYKTGQGSALQNIPKTVLEAKLDPDWREAKTVPSEILVIVKLI